MGSTEKQGTGSTAAKRRARYREIAEILREERLLEAFKGVGLEEHLPSGSSGASPSDLKEKDAPAPVRIRRALERLGPVYIKIGQMLATRADVVPPALLKELANLQDNVPAVAWPEMKACIEGEFGAPLADLFQTIQETPVAAASIGQVYRGTLADGTQVAIKVQRPGVTEAMDLDLGIMNDLAQKLERRVQWATDNQVAQFVQDFSDLLRAEIDYTNEARWLDRFRDAFADDDTIVFPGVYRERTTTRVLTMDWMEGVPATRLEDQTASMGVDRRALVATGVGAYFRMIFQLGFHHADPHAGNLFALRGGRLGFVDLGRVATVSEHTREAAFDMMLAMFDDDSSGVTDAVLSMTGVPAQIDVAAFELDVSGLLAEFWKQQESGKGLAELMNGLLRLLREHRLRIPAELPVLLSTLGVLDGVAHQLDPSFRMMDAAEPFARKYLPERYGLTHAWRSMTRSWRAYERLVDEFPVQATRALRRVGEGEFKVAVRPSDYHDVVERLTSVVYLLAFTVIAGALIIGFAFLAGQQGLSLPELIIYRTVLFLAVASVIGLFVTVIRNERRKRSADKRAQR
jgi:ubiquinone biosynthesis protein